MSNQPDIQNDSGAILTIGIICNGERMAVVEPYGFDSSPADPATMCNDLVTSWESSALPNFLACLSVDAAVIFVSADGMRDGKIPYREDFGPTTNPGTRTGAPLPNNVTGLLCYYEDPVDIPGGERIRVAKTFMPGMPIVDATGNAVSAGLQTVYGVYGVNVQSGFTSASTPANKWYRMLAVPKPRSASVKIRRTVTVTPRGYVCTQKRRLVPR